MNWYIAGAFVHAIEEHMLQAQLVQDRKVSFYWHMAWQNLIWPQFTDVLQKLLVTCTVSELVRFTPGAEEKLERASEKSPVWCGRKDLLDNFSQEKRNMQQLWMGWQTLAPPHALNIFNS